jgi:hypothetical protein
MGKDLWREREKRENEEGISVFVASINDMLRSIFV